MGELVVLSLADAAAGLPMVVDPGVAAPVVSVKPVVLPAPGPGEDLHLRVSAPATGRDLPVILFSHGNGSSLEGYGPLTDFWATHGFVVVQPPTWTLGWSASLPTIPASPTFGDSAWRTSPASWTISISSKRPGRD